MKQMFSHRFSRKNRQSSRKGMSLVEVVIVLGISSLLVGSAFAWFQSQKTTDFFDQMRQIESQIRKVQSDTAANIVPGFDSASCSTTDRAACVLQEGEQVFGTAIAIQKQLGASTDKMRIYYLKSTKPELDGTSQITRPIGVKGYGPSAGFSEDFELPASIRFYGYRVYNYTYNGTAYVCTRDPGSIDWEAETSGPTPAAPDITENVVAPPNMATASTGYSAIVFRRQPNAFYTFWNKTNSATLYNPGVIDPPFSTPPPQTPSSLDPRQVYNYSSSIGRNYPVGVTDGGIMAEYDPSYTVPTGPTPYKPMGTQPCAVSWRFGTSELTTAGKPRQTGEIVFDIQGASIKLKTR